MHILFITHYYAPDGGAAANRLTRLAQLLAQRGHRVTVLTTLPHYPRGVVPPEYRGRFQMSEEREGVRVVQVWLWTTPRKGIAFRLLSQLSFMVTAAIRGLFLPRPDVLFIEQQPIFTGLAGWFLSQVMRRPYLLNVSDYWPEYLYVAGVVSQSSVIYRVFAALASRVQQDAAVIVMLWPGLEQSIRARLSDPPPLHLIFNAVDLGRFHPANDDSAFRQRYDLGAAKLVSFLGVLGPHIDLETMLAAAKQLGQREDVTVLFVGTGAQADALAAALEEPEYAHCRWIEWIKPEELPGFWAATTVHFWALHDNPADKLRFQAKLYEALATGTPVVIALDGYMSALLAREEIGVTVPFADAQALAYEIERLLDDAQHKAQISENARAYAEAHFDPEQVADAYERLLLSANHDKYT